jgi:3-deoxy-D-manno-octulosonate 8-phosphate phosphatase KdsC-like HAD superfamily phosphatase
MDKSQMIENLLKAHNALSHVTVMGEDPNLLNLMAAKNTIMAVANALNQPEEKPTEQEGKADGDS